jgi:hypothetical protein
LLPFAAEALEVERIHLFHHVLVLMVIHPVEQIHDPVGVEFESGRLLPEPLAEGPIAPGELGFRQLAGEQKEQLPLLQGGKGQAGAGSALAMAPLGCCGFHGLISGRTPSRSVWSGPARWPWGGAVLCHETYLLLHRAPLTPPSGEGPSRRRDLPL